MQLHRTAKSCKVDSTSTDNITHFRHHLNRMQLTGEQTKIIKHHGGHARISAVAGSGKTTAMVGRVQHLLQQGVTPDKILVLMFNKSAREAFADRLQLLLEGTGLQSPSVRTFHSLGLRLINSFTARKILPSYKLLTEEYHVEKLAREAIKKYASQAGGDEQWWSRESMEGFLTFIDLVKAHTDSPQQIFEAYRFEEQLDYYAAAFTTFESMRASARVRFYADLIHEPVLAIRQDSQLADWVADHVDHIIVDEYQDINEVQQQLVKYIAGTRAKVMVVGDVDQCIYEWRGAKPEYIISRFDRDFLRPVTYTLSYTFRYGHRLALAANHLIDNNKMRDRKLSLARTDNPDTRIHCLEETDPHPIINIISGWLEKGRSIGEAAVLVRLYAQTVPVELALLEHSIPYQLVGHDTVFRCPEIMALLGYLHLCRGSLNEAEAQETSLARITAMLTNPHLWLKQDAIRVLAVNILNRPQSAAELIRQLAKDVQSTFLAERMIDLAAVWNEIGSMPPATPAAVVLEKVIRETELYDHYRYSSRPASAENKIKTCRAFVRFAGRCGLDVNDFLIEIKQLAEEVVNDSKKRLLITSIHRAKGLEWPLVILPGLEDGSVPYRHEDEEEGGSGIEDERRLFYVAMTRASEQVCFIHPPDSRLQHRKKSGDCRCPASTDDGEYPASCFLYESNLEFSDRLGERISKADTKTEPLQAADITIARRYIKAISTKISLKRTRLSPESEPDIPGHRPPLTINELAEGILVDHPMFGPGVVTGADRGKGVVTVHFKGHGSKNLVVKVAGLQPRQKANDEPLPF